jgi:biopolymer transport protein TolR
MGMGSHKRRSGRQAAFSDINVTPMVDVMLVLLVIFMVTAPMLTTGVSVNLPESGASPVAGQDEPLTISVTADGKVYVQKTEVAVKDLDAKLKAVTGAKKDTRIFVRGDKNVNYGKIVQVFGEISAAGFTRVALVTEVGSVPDKGR